MRISWEVLGLEGGAAKEGEVSVGGVVEVNSRGGTSVSKNS